MLQLLAASRGNQAAMDAFVSVIAGTMSPLDFLHPDHIARRLDTAAAWKAPTRSRKAQPGGYAARSKIHPRSARVAREMH